MVAAVGTRMRQVREIPHRDRLEIEERPPMMNPASVNNYVKYVKAEPFRPFRISMASGKTFDVRHPEMVKVGKTNLLVFSFVSDQPDVFDQWESVSLMLMESISHMESSISS
jgi:hypothetical protein